MKRFLILACLLAMAGCTQSTTIAKKTPLKPGEKPRIVALTVSSHVPRGQRASRFLRDEIEEAVLESGQFDKVEKEADKEDLWILVTVSDVTLTGKKSFDEGEPAVASTITARISYVQRSKPDRSDVVKGVASSQGGIILAGTTQAALDDMAKQVADHVKKHYKKKA